MKKIYLSIVVSAMAFASVAFAAALPGYYPAEGFQRTGRVDAFYSSESRVVINDVSYRVSESVVVHSLSRKIDSLARIRSGAVVGYRLSDGRRTIVEFWLLPGNYNPRSQR